MQRVWMAYRAFKTTPVWQPYLMSPEQNNIRNHMAQKFEMLET